MPDDLSTALKKDELQIFEILLKDKEIRIEVENYIGSSFITNIGTPKGDAASALPFILYLACRPKNMNVTTDGIYFHQEPVKIA